MQGGSCFKWRRSAQCLQRCFFSAYNRRQTKGAQVLSRFLVNGVYFSVGARKPRKNCGSHIDASHSRQPLVKGERLVRYEVNAVMPDCSFDRAGPNLFSSPRCFVVFPHGGNIAPQFSGQFNKTVVVRVILGAIAIYAIVAVLG